MFLGPPCFQSSFRKDHQSILGETHYHQPETTDPTYHGRKEKGRGHAGRDQSINKNTIDNISIIFQYNRYNNMIILSIISVSFSNIFHRPLSYSSIRILRFMVFISRNSGEGLPSEARITTRSEPCVRTVETGFG